MAKPPQRKHKSKFIAMKNSHFNASFLVLSIFSVVRFVNRPCRSTSQFTKANRINTFRNGTCLTSAECDEQGGSAAGSCAEGFGTCCVFAVTTTGNTINTNCTYLQNPGFPAVYGETNNVQYTISKCNCGTYMMITHATKLSVLILDVCYLRLDFECFTILGTGATTEANGGACIDTFTVTVNEPKTFYVMIYRGHFYYRAVLAPSFPPYADKTQANTVIIITQFKSAFLM